MPTFNWNENLKSLPQAWRATGGANVRIALLDSGADLDNDTLRHLGVDGRKFHVARPDFSQPPASLPPGIGRDDVRDARPQGNPHGTICLSVLAGKAQGASQVQGMAPEAEVFVLKISDAQRMTNKGYLLDGLELAMRLNADIVVCPVLPFFNGSYTEGRRQQVFDAMQARKTLFVSALKNTGDLAILNNLSFPAREPWSIVAGVAQDGVLANNPAASAFNEKMDLLLPQAAVRSYNSATPDAYPTVDCPSSLAAVCLAGALALLLGHLKAQPGFERPTRQKALSLLRNTLASNFDAQAMRNGHELRFYSLIAPST